MRPVILYRWEARVMNPRWMN
uniref:Uncharacterized protein n=1 Tax=Anguilla anguilla TaxID=7936 RepID=A0A0E9V2A8_ANGAN